MDDLIVSGLRIDWNMLTDSYVSRIPSLRSIDELEFHKNVIFLVGENGSGKSTLLEGIAVACGFNAEGGTRNYRFSTYDDTSGFAEAMTIYRRHAIGSSSFFLRAESYFTLATQAREYDHGGGLAHLHEMSHGEGFLEILLSRTGRGLYLLDEPESALSPQRQLTLLERMRRMADVGSQFIVATHSPILLGLPDAEILSFDGTGIHPCDYAGYGQLSDYQDLHQSSGIGATGSARR